MCVYIYVSVCVCVQDKLQVKEGILLVKHIHLIFWIVFYFLMKLNKNVYQKITQILILF